MNTGLCCLWLRYAAFSTHQDVETEEFRNVAGLVIGPNFIFGPKKYEANEKIRILRDENLIIYTAHLENR
jgi:hypothetical protein